MTGADCSVASSSTGSHGICLKRRLLGRILGGQPISKAHEYLADGVLKFVSEGFVMYVSGAMAKNVLGRTEYGFQPPADSLFNINPVVSLDDTD